MPGKDFGEWYTFNLPQLFGQGPSRELGKGADNAISRLASNMPCSFREDDAVLPTAPSTKQYWVAGHKHFQACVNEKLQTALIPGTYLVDLQQYQTEKGKCWSSLQQTGKTGLYKTDFQVLPVQLSLSKKKKLKQILHIISLPCCF